MNTPRWQVRVKDLPLDIVEQVLDALESAGFDTEYDSFEDVRADARVACQTSIRREVGHARS